MGWTAIASVKLERLKSAVNRGLFVQPDIVGWMSITDCQEEGGK